MVVFAICEVVTQLGKFRRRRSCITPNLEARGKPEPPYTCYNIFEKQPRNNLIADRYKQAVYMLHHCYFIIAIFMFNICNYVPKFILQHTHDQLTMQ